AVVAEEVRSLALRSKEAANKSEVLIRQSVTQTADGERSARDVAAKLGQINSGIDKVASIMGEIAGAAREQASGVEQVSRAVVEMDKVTQQNAASAEESSSSAAELASQSTQLANLVAAWKLDIPGDTPLIRPPTAKSRLTDRLGPH
ncbi:MAG TPA: methyl-accepting chemotaxis protein, partial [Polyangia bacterium]